MIADRRQLLVATPERFRDLFNIEVRTRHEVCRIDRRKRTIEVQNLQTGALSHEPYDALVLAPGPSRCGRRCRASICPASSPCATWTTSTRSTRGSTDRRVARAVVVGGGYIGLEMVENLSRRGLNVTLLELTDQVMPPMDPEMVAPGPRGTSPARGRSAAGRWRWPPSSRARTIRSAW